MTLSYFKEVVQNLLRDFMYNEWRSYIMSHKVTEKEEKLHLKGFWAFENVIYISST